MSKKKIVKAILKEVVPDVAKKVAKSAPSKIDDIARKNKKLLKETSEDIIRSKADDIAKKTLQQGGEEVGERAFEEVSSRISKAQKQQAEKAAQSISAEEAKKATETLYGYSVKGLQEEEKAVSEIGKTFGDTWEAVERGDATKEQFLQVIRQSPSLEQISEKSKGFAGGAGQVLQQRSEYYSQNQNAYLRGFLERNNEKLNTLRNTDEEVYAKLFNLDFFDENQMNMAKQYDIIPKETKIFSKEEALEIGKSNPEYLDAYMKNIDNKAWQKANAFVVEKSKSAGNFKKLFTSPSHVAKNIMLLLNVTNRAWDLGSNYIMHGISLVDVGFASHLSGKARRTFSKLFGKNTNWRALLEMEDSYFAGEAAKNANGMLKATIDTIKETANNIKNFAKDKDLHRYKQTAIGKHNSKIAAGLSFERNNEFSQYVLPESINAINDFLKADVGTKTKQAAGFIINKAGYYGAGAPDVFAGGSFRAGNFMQDSYAKAMQLAGSAPDEIIEKHGGLKNYADEIMNTYIALDDGKSLTKQQQQVAREIFGRGKEGEQLMLDSLAEISKQAGEDAAQDVFRSGGTKTVYGKIATGIDQWMANPAVGKFKVPVVGEIYNAMFPLVKTNIRMIDKAISYNPLSAGADLIKELKKAKAAIAAGVKPNMRAVDKAIGKLTTGSIMYAGAYELFANKYITGKFNSDERKALQDLGIKEESICVSGKCYPYKKLGVLGIILSNVANVFNDIKDINENYEDLSNTYGAEAAALDMIGLLADPLAGLPIGDMLTYGTGAIRNSKTPAEATSKIAEKIINSWAGFFKRKLTNSDGYLLESITRTSKNLKDAKSKMALRLDCWGHPVKDSIKIKDDPLSMEMWYQDAMCGEFPWTKGVNSDGEDSDSISVPLMQDERYYWRKMMSNIYDPETDTYYDAHDKMSDFVFGRENYKDTSYTELDVVARDLDGNVVPMYKKKILKEMYSDLRNKAFNTFLSYKDKENLTEEEKDIAECAKNVYNRMMEKKKQQMEIHINPLPINTKPTLP